MSTPFRRDYKVDILVRGKDNSDLTWRLFDSIKRQTDPELYQLTYVDNGSARQPITQMLMAQFPEHQYLLLPRNYGSIRAINLGLSVAMENPAPYTLIMDNDTTIPEGDRNWLERWIGYFDDERVGAAGAVSDYVSGYQFCEAVPDLYQKDWKVEKPGQPVEQGFKEPYALPLLVSFAMMLRKKAVSQTGTFDELYQPGNFEDYDYTLRMHMAGWRCIIANSVWIHHKGSQTFKDMGFQNLLEINQQKFIDKWGKERLAEVGVVIS